MRSQKHEPDHLPRHPLVQQIPHGEEVAQRLGHLLPLHLQHLVVHPDPGELPLRMGALRLRDLVLVVRKHQVIPAAVNIERLPQQRIRHGRALDMPPRPPLAPRALPPRLTRLRRLPEHEVHRVFLVGRHFDPRPRDHVIHRAARQRAIGLVGPHPEQHVPLRLIGMAARNQILDHRHHRADPLGRARHIRRLQRPHGRHVLQIPPTRLLGDLPDVPPALLRPRDDLVIHVGEVAHIAHVLGPIDMPQQAEQHVEHDDRPRVADMRPVIDRRPADIHAHPARRDGDQKLFLPGLGVVQMNVHEGSSGVPAGFSNFVWMRKETWPA